jgi:hypothetical protein
MDSDPPIMAQFASPELDIAALIPGATCAAVACCTGSLLQADSNKAAHPTQNAARIFSPHIELQNLCIIGITRPAVESRSAVFCAVKTITDYFQAKV